MYTTVIPYFSQTRRPFQCWPISQSLLSLCPPPVFLFRTLSSVHKSYYSKVNAPPGVNGTQLHPERSPHNSGTPGHLDGPVNNGSFCLCTTSRNTLLLLRTSGTYRMSNSVLSSCDQVRIFHYVNSCVYLLCAISIFPRGTAFFLAPSSAWHSDEPVGKLPVWCGAREPSVVRVMAAKRSLAPRGCEALHPEPKSLFRLKPNQFHVRCICTVSSTHTSTLVFVLWRQTLLGRRSTRSNIVIH